MAYRLSYSDYAPPAAPPAPPVVPPTPESIPGGPGFGGFPQPPDVPCDPTGDGWRGPPGPPGPPMGALTQDTPPANPVAGQLWFDTSNPQLYLWYVDPTSSQWVIATAYAGGLTSDAPSDGQVYGRQNGVWTNIAAGGPYLPLSGGTVSGPTTFGGPVTISSGTVAPATLTPFPKTPRIYRSGIIPAKHLPQARAGFANAANTAGGARLTFIVAGDSTGTQAANNALAPEDNIFGRIKSYVRRANPGISFDLIDRSVPGATWGALASRPTANWPAWYTDHAQNWISYYVAPNAVIGNVAPDVVFIPIGTNDGPADSASTGVPYLASVFGFFANAAMFPVTPDVVLVTNKGAGPAQGGDRIGFQQVAGLMRCIHYAGTSVLGVTGRTPGLIDLGRYDTMSRWGYDPCVQHLVPTLTNITGISTFPYTLPQCDGDFDLSVVWPAQGSTWCIGGQLIEFDVSGTIATGSWTSQVRIGRNSTLFSAQYLGNANPLNLTPPNVPIGTGDVTIRITCRQEQLRVTANGTVLFEGAVLRPGGKFTPVVKFNIGPSFGPMSVLSYSAGACLRIEQSITDPQTWGDGSGTDGNGVNHASSWGIAEMETLLLESSEFNLTADGAGGGGGSYLPLAGGTVTGATTFSAAGNALTVTNTIATGTLTTSGATGLGIGNSATTTGAVLTINGAAGNTRRIELYTANALRWRFGATSGAEGGANAGSDFFMNAYDDAGSTNLGTAINVNRATQLTTLTSLAVTGAATHTGASTLTGATSFGNGVTFGTQVGANSADMAKHIQLSTTGVGFNTTASRLNYIAPAAYSHVFTIAGTDVATVNNTGLGINTGFGLNLGSQVAASNTDLSKHIRIYGTNYGFGLTGARLNYVVPTGSAHVFLVNGVDSLTVGGNTIGFQGSAPIARPTISGACAGNTAIKALLTALVSYGLITDSTTA